MPKSVLLAILIASVVAAVLFVYWPALSAQALYIDDYQYVVNNPLIRSPGWASASRFLSEVLTPSTVEGYYQPLSMISLMLDFSLGGRENNLMPFHRTSLALHAANTALIIVLLYMLFGRPWIAAAVGLLFGLHPITVETIPWVGERKTLLAAFFAFWCLILYVRYAQKGSWKFYIGCFLLYLLALMSKPTSTPLPLLMLLLDFWPLNRLKWRTVIEKIPFFAVGCIFAIITFISQTRTAGTGLPSELGAQRVFLTLCHNIIFYLFNIIWPFNLSPHYSVPAPLGISNPMVLAGVVGTVILISLLLLSIRWTRAALTGWLFFFLAILPAMQLIGFSHVIAADKFAYLPAFGLLMILAALSIALKSKINSSKFKIPVSVVMTLLILILASAESFGVRRYLANWQTSKGLYGYVLARNPDSAPFHLGMAVALQSEGKLAEAVEHFRQVMRLEPNLPSAPYNLANALRQQGKYDEAVVCYRRALQLQPNDANYYNNLGTVLAMQGKLDDAAASFNLALRIDPNNVGVHYNLALLLSEQKKFAESISHYRFVLRYDPDNMQIYLDIAFALQSEGKINEALNSFRDAARVAPYSPVPLTQIAQILATCPDPNIRDTKHAIEYCLRAAELTEYLDAAVLNNLAVAYAEDRQFDKAANTAQKALELAIGQKKTDLAEHIRRRLDAYKQAAP
jgi:tetratricopeptide (TPR) repeat protein